MMIRERVYVGKTLVIVGDAPGSGMIFFFSINLKRVLSEIEKFNS